MAPANGHSAVKPPSIEDLSTKLRSLGVSDAPQMSPAQNIYPQYNVLDVYRAHITSHIHKITNVEPEIIGKALQLSKTLDNGDLVIQAAALRIKGRKPDELAKEIVGKFPAESPLIEQPTLGENGFVQFRVKAQPLFKILVPSILQQKEQYGFNSLLGREDPSNPTSRQKRVVVEFSSPNIAKEFHTGHLRSTIIGGFLCHMYELAGWDVVAMNYLGDWGKQYGVLSLGFEKYGSEEKLVENPIKHLNEVYVKINQDSSQEQAPVKALKEKIDELKKMKNPPPAKKKDAKDGAAEPPKSEWSAENEAELKKTEVELNRVIDELVAKPSIDEKARQFFKKMVDNDKDAIGNWERFRSLSIKRYEEMYARLNITFDDYSGESTVQQASMDKAAVVMKDKGISEQSEGATIINFTKHVQGKVGKALGKAVLVKKDGTSLYLTRDIAANQERYQKYNFDRMIYVVASQQDAHLQQCFKILELMGDQYAEAVKKCDHITFGMVKDARGENMSTRKGNVLSLEDSLDDVGKHMHAVMNTNADKFKAVEDPTWTADTLGMSAIMVQDYTGKRINGYNFDIDRMCNIEGDTGPYLQYSHTRLCSMKRQSDISEEEMLNADFSLITAQAGVDLLRNLARWPFVFNDTLLRTQEPVTVLTYLMELTHQISSTYEASEKSAEGNKERTMSVKVSLDAGDREKAKAIMALYESARQVLNNGMRLLGLTPVERM